MIDLLCGGAKPFIRHHCAGRYGNVSIQLTIWQVWLIVWKLEICHSNRYQIVFLLDPTRKMDALPLSINLYNNNNPSSFLIHHRAIPWHTLATYQWGALPSSRGDIFAAKCFLLRIQSADATAFTGPGPFQLQKTFVSSGQCSNRAVDTQGQRRDIVSGQEICSGKCHGCQVSCHQGVVLKLGR